MYHNMSGERRKFYSFLEKIQPKSTISIVNLRQREKSRSQRLKKYRNLGGLNIKSQNLGSPKGTISVL